MPNNVLNFVEESTDKKNENSELKFDWMETSRGSTPKIQLQVGEELNEGDEIKAVVVKEPEVEPEIRLNVGLETEKNFNKAEAAQFDEDIESKRKLEANNEELGDIYIQGKSKEGETNKGS